jgi:hypothetical protein
MKNFLFPFHHVTRAGSFILIVMAGGSVTAAYPGSAFAGSHACDYLTKSMVEEVMGTTAANPEAHSANPMGQTICFYDLPDAGGMQFAQVQMVRSDWAKRSPTKFKIDELFTNNMSYLEGLVEVDGIGQKAYWGGAGLKMGAGLHVLSDDTYFTVIAQTGEEKSTLEKTQTLASRILDALK